MGVSNDTYAWLVRNRIVTLEMMKDDLVDYFSNSDEVLSEVLWPEGGFFDGVTLAADGNDKFKIGGLSGVDGAVGGDLLNLTDRQADVEGVQFENTNLADYHVGLQDARLPEEIVVNPKDGLPNWTRYRHIVGMQDVPDAVNDNGDGTITFTVDSLTEASVSNAGRQVYVFMAALPGGAITNAIAIELLPVVWDASNNKITTVDDLGQAVISTTPGDYVMVLVGPHVLKNTDISTDTTYAYVGTVQGVGAGGPPTVFDVSGQRLLSASSSLLWQITRTENVPPNRLKIDVKALAGESGVNQIQVQDSGSNVKFSVDEAGNVVVEGDFEVKGTTTTRDVDQINTHDAYFDNLDAGNADTDGHDIQGTWRHTSSGGGITAFTIHGTSGRVGIGGNQDATAALKVTGDSLFVGHLVPGADDTYDLGESGTPLEWRNLYLDGTGYIDSLDAGEGKIIGDSAQLKLSNIPFRIDVTGAGADEKKWALEVVSGANEVLTFSTKTDTWTPGAAFLEVKRTVDSTAIELLTLTATKIQAAGTLQPDDGTRSLGGSTNKWKLFYVSDSATEGIAGNLVPTVIDAHDLGNATYKWEKLFLSSGANEGVATDLVPASTLLDLGNGSYPWQKLYLGTGANGGVSSHLEPIDSARNLGSASYPWQNLFLSTAAGKGVATNLVPATTALELGNTGYPWKKLWVSSAADEGVATHLVPVSLNNFDLGNSSYKWRSGYFSSTVEADQLRATGDTSGGAASTITFTGLASAPANTDLRTVVGQGVGANEGYVKIYVAGAAKYMPYWATV